MKEFLMFDTDRDGYCVDQCGKTMTVGELIELLSQYDEDTEIFYRNDNGYTYGRITEGRIDIHYIEDEDEE